MKQKFRAQVLTSKTHPERKQARGPVINLFQNETYLKQIAANAASGAGLLPGIDGLRINGRTIIVYQAG